MSAPFAFQFLSRQCPNCFARARTHLPNTSWRHFTSNASRRAQAQASPAHESSLKFAGRRSEGIAKFERAVAKKGSIPLYEAPRQRAYILGAYGLSAFCFAYAVYHSNAIFRDPIMPVELPRWQKLLFGGICISMSGMGTFFFFRTGRLIKTMHGVRSNGQTHVQVRVRQLLPFRKPYKLEVLPRQVAFCRSVPMTDDFAFPGTDTPTNEAPKLSWLRNPVKRTSMAGWNVFLALRRVFTQENFILMEFQNHKEVYKLDSEGIFSEHLFGLGNSVHSKH